MTCILLASPRPTLLSPTRRITLLTAEQERQLAQAVAAGDLAARDRLVEANQGLVVTIARHFEDRGLELEDLIAEGHLGLIRAASEFDPGRGTRFSTCAGYWIREAIFSALANTATTVRLPVHMVQLLRHWRRAEVALGRESGDPAWFEEVADRLGLTAEQRELVRKALRVRRLAAAGGSSATIGAVGELADPAEGPAEAVGRRDQAQDLRARMAGRLDARERRMLELRFGLDSGEPLTLTEVGARMGMTREGARKMEARAVAKLRD